MRPIELLAPAGDLEAAYAAFHYGADAIYLGLKRFSARAEAANFSRDELGEIVAFAHAAAPRRSVFVALNTLVSDQEIDAVIENLSVAADMGVDALIAQDLGVIRLVRLYFPGLRLHASTQMTIHNLEGALMARELGMSRVTLARELTLAEIGRIVARSGLEVEVFIHGALCYSYSGLCLYSSLLRGRSGNRGRCTYPCRECFKGGGLTGLTFPFSMKDMALVSEVRGLREAGVRSLKIEGRKKGALYVATATHHYRRILDGVLPDKEREGAEEDLKTVFSRPWTDLYLKSRRNPKVIDTVVVGHRGALIGQTEAEAPERSAAWLRFRTRRRLERHDGLQIDLPGQGRPFGFAVDRLRVVAGKVHGGDVFEAPAKAMVEVRLPPDHPRIQAGAPVYCSSSQAVKQRYRFPTPKPGTFRARKPIRVAVTLHADRLTAEVELAPGVKGVGVTVERKGAFSSSRDPGQVEEAARSAFGKLGDTPFELTGFAFNNPGEVFVPVSEFNRLRREALGQLEAAVETVRRSRVAKVQQTEAAGTVERVSGNLRWSLKTDRVGHVRFLDAADWEGVEEVVLDIGFEALPEIEAGLKEWVEKVGRDRIRLGLPIIAREWEMTALRKKVEALSAAGWMTWEAGHLYAWPLLKERIGEGGDPQKDLTADWSVYVMNRLAARQVLEMGAVRVTLSPEDDFENMRGLLAGFGDRTTVVLYQDPPLFVSENCVMAAGTARCPACDGCRDAESSMVSAGGERVRVIQRGCRTILTNEVGLDLSRRLEALSRAGAVSVRADFINRHYRPEEVQNLWRALRAGRSVSGWEGNFSRGLK